MGRVIPMDTRLYSHAVGLPRIPPALFHNEVGSGDAPDARQVSECKERHAVHCNVDYTFHSRIQACGACWRMCAALIFELHRVEMMPGAS